MRMKKFFTTMLVAFAAIAAYATDFNESIIVTVNGVSSEQNGVISLVQNGNTYDLTMKNFMLTSEDGDMPIGNVSLTGIVPVRYGNAIILKTKENIIISDGDAPGVDFWMGPMLGLIPVDLQGVVEGENLRCVIHIDLLETLQQVIEVSVGKGCKVGYQMPNQSFEAWHTSTGSYVEPNGWHSFESATGSLVSMAGHHITKSTDAHSGSASARIYATSILGIVANGTMTTGRMNAGSMSASNTSNNAYLDTSKTDVDGNGDPFYTPLFTCPDSIAVWVKFKQGKANAAHPYATMSAVITDGSYYQDPQDKDYSNVVAKAGNGQIAETGEAWVRVSAPFNYTANAVDPQAILITISTNADPGQGSANDEVLVDDIALIYNAKLASLLVKGQELEGFNPDKKEYEVNFGNDLITIDDFVGIPDGCAALVINKVEPTDTGYKAIVKVLPGDMENITEYVLNVKSTASAISQVKEEQTKNNVIYNLNGQQVKTAKKGLYIVNGKKVVVK